MAKLRWAPLLLAALLLPLAAACGGGGDREPPPPAASPEAAVDDESSPEVAFEEGGDGEAGVASGSETFNPLSFLTGGLPGLGGDLSGVEVSADVDPSLKAALLRQEDLPGEFGSLGGGELTYSVPVEGESVDMAMSMFFSGDPMAEEMGATVISAVVAMPPDLLKQSLAQFPSGDDIESELEGALGQAGDVSGLGFVDVEVLDASGLGEQGIGMHMVMDFGQLLGGLVGEDQSEELEQANIAFDMYIFTRADRMLMLMVMWPGDQSRPADGKALAEIMDQRAEEAF